MYFVYMNYIVFDHNMKPQLNILISLLLSNSDFVEWNVRCSCYRVSSDLHQTKPAKESLKDWQEIHSGAKFLGSLV